MHAYRSHTCAELNKSNVGETARLSGWVHRVRDHGGLLFIDLRDHYGMTQIVADPDSAAFKTAEMVRGEWVIRVDGDVKARSEETVNPTCRPAQSRCLHAISRYCRRRASCRCRCLASLITRKISA
jgi:aspartyl-tRNA synthetase